MRRTRSAAQFAALLSLLLFALPVLAAKPGDAFFERQFGPSFFDAYWAEYPDFGISVGYYKYADKLIVPDARARAAELKFLRRWQTRLHKIDRNELSDSHRADWEMLDNEFASRTFALEQLRAWQWDPSTYNVADGFARILTTDYAPLDRRLRTVLKRLARVPEYYAAAERAIDHPSREHTQLAIEQNHGVLTVLGDNLDKQIAASHLSTSERRLFAKRLAAARSAAGDYIAWLQNLDAQLAAGGARSFRLGRDLYERKFELDIQTGDTAQALFERAQREKERLHATMGMLADMLWPKYFPDTAPPADRLDKIGKLIDKISEQHVAPDRFFDTVKHDIPEMAKWVTDHHLLTLDADKPLKVRITPEHQRGVSVASIDAPGPYDPTAPTYFNVMPLDDLSAAQAESLLREYNNYMLPILVIHEAIPGHYAQLVYANKSPSRIKAIFGNGAMVEGWAVYGERMMLESGFGDDTAEMWLIYSKWLLRSVCNTILDYSVHVLNMSEADAMHLLTHEAFQSHEEAAGKWRRVQLTSVQLTSYFAGFSAIYQLREQLKHDWGDRFDLKRFNEQFLSYGNAPVRVIAELMRAAGPR